MSKENPTIIDFKITCVVDPTVMKTVLQERGIKVNATNINKLKKLISKAQFQLEKEFFDEMEKDREILLMHGFTFEE